MSTTSTTSTWCTLVLFRGLGFGIGNGTFNSIDVFDVLEGEVQLLAVVMDLLTPFASCAAVPVLCRHVVDFDGESQEPSLKGARHHFLPWRWRFCVASLPFFLLRWFLWFQG